MTISRKLNKPHQPNLIMNNTIIILLLIINTLDYNFLTMVIGINIANNFIVELISVSMSFMKTMNKRGPRIDPWGTPAFMSRQLEVELLITTRCFLSDK
jgi:hypothetical protein